MRKISDEALMAYADGDIADDLRRQVETYLANDPDGQRRLAAFALTGRQLGRIFDQPMREPVPVHLIDFVRVGANDRAGASRKWPPEVRFPKRHHPRMLGMSSRTWALAASVASLFAIGASSLLYFERQPDAVDISFGLVTASDGRKIAAKVLAAVLETAPSGNVIRTIGSGQASIRPSFTFQASNGEYCRQYEILRVKNSGSSGVACREADGIWRVKIHTPFAERHAGDGNIVPAGKESSQAIDATVDRLISGDVLGPLDEDRIMKNGWRGAKP